MPSGENVESEESRETAKSVPQKAGKQKTALALKAVCLVLALVAVLVVCLMSMRVHVQWLSRRLTVEGRDGQRSTIEFQYPENWICTDPASRLEGATTVEIAPKPVSGFVKWCSASIPMLHYLDTRDKIHLLIACPPPEISQDPFMIPRRWNQEKAAYLFIAQRTGIHIDQLESDSYEEKSNTFYRWRAGLHEQKNHYFLRTLVVYRRRARNTHKPAKDFVYGHYILRVEGDEPTEATLRPRIDEIFRRVRLVDEK